MSLAVAESAVVAKSPRRQSAKAPKVAAAKPTKISVYISAESAKRLGVTSTMEGQSQSAIVEALIREHLRRWVVQDRRGKSDDQAGLAMEEVSGVAA